MIKRSLILILLILTIIICSGCNLQKDKIYLIFNSEPITKENALDEVRHFDLGQKTYYAILAPNGFKYHMIRVQVYKQDDKVERFGYTIYQTKDFILDINKNYFINDLRIGGKGLFIMHIFYLNDKNFPIVRGEFWIK